MDVDGHTTSHNKLGMCNASHAMEPLASMSSYLWKFLPKRSFLNITPGERVSLMTFLKCERAYVHVYIGRDMDPD